MRWIAIVLTGSLAASCKVGRDDLMFVTRTNVAIDLDTQPATTDIGYKRDEIVLAPVDPGGAVLPVLTTVGVEANPFDFGANHSFATGDAALVIARYLLTEARPAADLVIDQADVDALSEQGTIARADNKRYYFGTNTVLGLGVQWNAEYVPTAIAIGYKRKELAFVPLGVGEEGGVSTRTVASLIATAHSGTDVGGERDTRAIIGQTFATGAAATYLAMHPEVRRAIGPSVVPNYDEARVELERIKAANVEAGVFAVAAVSQDALIEEIVTRYRGATDAQKLALTAEAVRLGLVPGPAGTTTLSDTDFSRAISRRANGTDPAVTRELQALNAYRP